MPKIDDAAYEAGKSFFREGKSLRSVIEPMMAMADDKDRFQKSQAARDLDESLSASTLLGFADAVLDSLRAVS